MAMTRLVDLADIAQLIETDLNDVSTNLFNSTAINNHIIFEVKDNFDDYDSATTTYDSDIILDATDIEFGKEYEIVTQGTTNFKSIGSLSNEIGTKFTATNSGTGTGTVYKHVRFTPCLLKKLSSTVVPDPNIGAYNETYTLELYGYQKEYDEVKEILDTYVLGQRGAYRTIAVSGSSWLVQEVVEGFDFAGNITPDDGTRDDRFYGLSTLFWGFLDGGVHSTQVTIQINGTTIPVSSFNLQSQKNFVGGIFNGTDNNEGIAQSAGMGFNLTIPLLNNVETQNLAKDIMLNTGLDLNTSYTLRYSDGVLDQTYTVIRTQGSLGYEVGGIVTLDVSFGIFKTGVL